MKLPLLIIFSLLVFFSSLAQATFPKNFLFGSATASYQVEGAWNISRGPSIWDVFSHEPGHVYDNENGDVADDEYHLFEQDIARMRDLGLLAYRFSISWNRIFINGEGEVNQDGIDYYNKVINTLLANNIVPFVTLFHWDLPQHLYTQYPHGWTSPAIVDKFRTYASTCFKYFGDRVHYWLTFNEPLSFCNLGYGEGIHAPGRCSDRSKCPEGDSSTEPYLCAHHVLLSHAAAVHEYRTKYKQEQGGEIGITLNCDWTVPLTESSEDQAAAQRHLEFQLGWYADPVWFGDYPQSMRALVGDRLPKFTPEQQEMLRGSHDFFGLNHYTSVFAANVDSENVEAGSWDTDQKAAISYTDKEGNLIGPVADSPWLHVVPFGIEKMLVYVALRYNNPPIYITENGVDVPGESSMPLAQALNDTFRVNFYRDYLYHVNNAIELGVDVRSYFAWSLLDNFEWADGYSKRFGMHYVDYDNNLKRYTKDSAKWYSNFIQTHT